ncbi:MAG: DUF4266 domain-containing protein [Proteobacteria bacterium]|nr:DUF4266 domain-containing protein [Pseudomonadota bacterium]
MKRVLFILLLVATAAAATGCANVQPWEKEFLASPAMRFDSDKEETAVREHFLGTREGASGGFGVSGGGCGCN